MAVPMRQGAAHRRLPDQEQDQAGREVPADRRARTAVRLQPQVQRLRQDPADRTTCSSSGCRSSRRSTRSWSAGAPMVSIAGGEPLMHPQIDEIVNELVKRKKFVYLCTNAELVRKRFDKFNFKPSHYFSFAVHIDGLRERHDESVAKEGVFDEAVAAIKFLKEKGFRVTTNSTFFNTDTPQTIIDVLNFLNDELKVDQMMISPAYAYEKAPDQDHFLGVDRDPRAVHEGVRRRQPQALAAQPLAAVPRLPRGQGRLRVHRVGHPVLLAARLAEALLPDGRRLRRRPTRSSSRPPTGTSTAAARTSAATTAWRTAATSRPPSWPRWAR